MHIPSIYLLWRLTQLSQKDLVFILSLCCQKLTCVVRIVRGQQVKEGTILQSLYLMNIIGLRFDNWHTLSMLTAELFQPNKLLGINILGIINFGEMRIIDGRYFKMTIHTFWYPCHFGMTMPIKLLPSRNYYEKQSKLFLSLNRKRNNAIGRLELFQDLAQFLHLYFIYLILQEFEMIWLWEALWCVVVVLLGDLLNQVE